MPPQQKSDPWVEAAKNFKPQADAGGAAPKPDEDWKLWQEGNSASNASEVQPGNAFTSGHFLDTLRANEKDALRPSDSSDGGIMSRGLHDFGRGATQTLISPLLHPLETVKGMAKMGLSLMSPSHGIGDPDSPLMQAAGSTISDFQDNGAAKAIPNVLGQVAGSVLAGEFTGGALRGAGKMAAPVGAAIERGGLGVINHALEVTPKMMKYGQNPARGLVDEGIAPSMSKFSLGNKLERALPAAGARVGDAVESSPFRIPEDNIAKSINGPIDEGRSVIEGPGGANRSAAPLEALRASMAKRAPGATRPIYRADDPFQPTQPFDPTGTIHNAPRLSGTADASAPDIWRSIQNIDRNTRFNPDPEVEGVNEVRRDIRGGLRGNLEDAVPGLKPLSQRYGDLRTASDALDRTAGRGSPLKSLKDVFSFPLETTGGTAMVRGGRMMQTPVDDPFLSRTVPATTDLFMGAKSPRKENR